MPQLTQVFNAYPMSITLDANGNGALMFQAVGSNVRINNRSVRVSTAVKQAIATTYRGQIGDAYRLDATNSGSTGDNATSAIELRDGECIYIVWTGGDVGATATATFSGVTLPFEKLGALDTGKGWNNPIAAGDGTLIYPALKSPNFVTGVTGWTLNRNGDVEFNSAIIRGSLIAGNGTVILNGNGIHVEGINRQYDVNSTTGFLARPLPADGAYTQMGVINGSSLGGYIAFNSTNPTVNGNSLDPGLVFGSNDLTFSPTDDHPFLLLKSPIITGKAAARINLFGQTNGSATDNTYVDVLANQFRVNGNDMGYGCMVFDTTSGATAASSATTDTIVQTASTPNLSPNRKYRVVFSGTVGGTVANDRIGFRVYRGATLLADFGQVTLAAASVSQPYTFTYGLIGATGQDVTLQARRVAGTGTWTVGYKYVELTDITS